MAEIKSLEGQNILDMSIQECGSVEAAFAFAVENDLSVTDELLPGQAMKVINAVEKPVANYYKSNRLKPATNDTPGTEYETDRIFGEEFPLEFS